MTIVKVFDLNSSGSTIEQPSDFEQFSNDNSLSWDIYNNEDFISDFDVMASESITSINYIQDNPLVTVQLAASPVTLNHSFLEVLAKDFAYRNWSSTVDISKNELELQNSVYNVNKIPYKVDKIWDDKNTGFFAVGLTALNQPSILAIKGSANALDFLDDTNPKGVGFNQFISNKDSVNNWLNSKSQVITTTPYITGHSLGGALSQWMASYSTSINRFPLAEVVTFNAPGISPTVNVDGINYGSNSFKSNNVKNGVTHYVTATDVVSLAGLNYINGDFQLFQYTVRPGFIIGPHTNPLLASSIGSKQKPSNGVLQQQSFSSLNSPNFNYNSNIDHILVRIAMTYIPAVGPTIAKGLGSRIGTETLRTGAGLGINTIISAISFLNDNIFSALINGGSSAINAISEWSIEGWKSVSVWTGDTWKKAGNWTTGAWDSTKNFTADAWNKVTDTLSDIGNKAVNFVTDEAITIFKKIIPFFSFQTLSDESLASGEVDRIFEDNSKVEVSIRISQPSDQVISIEYNTADNTAIEGEDYVASSGILTFLPGETEKQIPVELLNFDTWQEGKTFNIQLGNPENILLLLDDEITVTVNPNDSPLVFNSIPAQDVEVNNLFSLKIPKNTFVDEDISKGDSLTYTATLADGKSLPSWLVFDPSTLSFSGTPNAIDLDNITIKVTATDQAGESASFEIPLNVVIPEENLVLPAGANIGTLFKDNEADNTFQGSTVPDKYELTSESSNIIQGNLIQLNGDSLSQFHSDDVILVKNTQFRSQQLTFNENILQIDVNNDGETDANIMLEGDYSNGSFIVKQLLNDTTISFNTAPTGIFLANAITELNNNILVRDGIELAEIVIEDDGLGVNEISLTGKDKDRFEIRDNALFLIGANPNSEIQDQYEVTLTVDDSTIDNQPDVTTNYTLNIVNSSDDVDTLLNSPFYRFQNSDIPSIYIWAGEDEKQTIAENYPNFKEEGVAFKVAVEPNDNLIQFNRFQNELGAYLYAAEEESINIRENYPNFKEEGIAFYALDSNANRGIDIYRLQNTQQPGTYIFIGEEEKNNILANSPQFQLEGVAFEAVV
jgi:Putative Ig domain/Calx-beta domain/Lipase (class 3)